MTPARRSTGGKCSSTSTVDFSFTTKNMRTTTTAKKATFKAKPTPDIIQAPEWCVTARVREIDALWIARRCKEGDNLKPWIVAGVLAEAGEGVIRGDTFHSAGLSRPDIVLKKGTASSVWEVINREPEDFTHEIPVAIPEAEKCLMETDAEMMRRDLSDWLGTLIKAGIEILNADKNLVFLTNWRGFDLLARSIELQTMKEQP